MSRNLSELILAFSFMTLIYLSCTSGSTTPTTLPKACDLLTQAEAEKILGEPARQTEDVSEVKEGMRNMRCTYTAKDKSSGKEYKLFFVLERKEQNPTSEQAHQVFASTKKDNERDSVLEDVSGIGDEAYLHVIKPNFIFLMAREDETTIRFKINRVSETASVDELKAFAKKVAGKL